MKLNVSMPLGKKNYHYNMICRCRNYSDDTKRSYNSFKRLKGTQYAFSPAGCALLLETDCEKENMSIDMVVIREENEYGTILMRAETDDTTSRLHLDFDKYGSQSPDHKVNKSYGNVYTSQAKRESWDEYNYLTRFNKPWNNYSTFKPKEHV